MLTLATLFSTGADLRSVLSSERLPEILDVVDDFFTRGTSIQSSVDVPEQVAAAKSLATDARAVFALYSCLAQAPAPLLHEALECGVLHVTRLVPFCQIYGVKNARAVAALLDALVNHVPAVSTMLHDLRQFYMAQLKELDEAATECLRNSVGPLIRRCAEMCFSIGGISTAASVAAIVLLQGNTLDAELRSRTPTLLSRLLQCYEVTLPALQHRVDERRWLALIATCRHVLLQILGRCLDIEIQRVHQPYESDELVAGLYAISNGAINKSNTDTGSFLSDLWYVSEYQDKVRDVVDRETFGYLDQVIAALPRRRLPVNDKVQVDVEQVALNANRTEQEQLVSLIHQVQEVFPTVGDGYVELCLLCSKMQVEPVINWLVENQPPAVLRDVPLDLKASDPQWNEFKAQVSASKTATLDPKRMWMGKKPSASVYDPQVARSEQQLVEKVKQFVAMYENEDEASQEDHVDEYDDEYFDEWADVVPMSDTVDEQEAIREENRKIRAKEEKEAFWEAIKNRNREQTGAPGEEEEEKAPSSRPTLEEPKHKSDEALTHQQRQRQRARKDKNKAKVANHHRKERARKKLERA
ncbi:hypothetical protein PsorP6_015677 [Peronosclerospora sorghi]|uniref:Uncharacterized protein n=1 Tax=Peronosclerospora sorghi TaxID=230839 RepID=A0ACC0WQ03_9STRA|nr:hypothetical protein PsorP6_015677 [Peronosclerospora sorghi]